jgi:hypothetical protein
MKTLNEIKAILRGPVGPAQAEQIEDLFKSLASPELRTLAGALSAAAGKSYTHPAPIYILQAIGINDDINLRESLRNAIEELSND